MAGEEGFYLSLPSNGSLLEYPDNQPNKFKIRLPTPIQLSGEGWRVGLVSISMPDSKLHLPVFTFDDQPLFQMRWKRWRDNVTKVGFANYERQEVEQVFEGIDGVAFMKSMITFMHHKQYYKNKGPHLGFHFATNDGKRTYIKFKWEGEELVTDNQDTDKTERTDGNRPALKINKNLAHIMGWVTQDAKGNYVLGPNIRQEFFTDTIPDPDPADADVLAEDALVDGHKIPAFWGGDGDYYRFSYWCNWRFINLNKAFQKLVGSASRSLFVYSDAAQSSVVGNKVTDLLREVNYVRKGRGVAYFEPLHIQYIPVRKPVLDIIETQIGETDGPLAEFKFGDGQRTVVTLHFKRTK